MGEVYKARDTRLDRTVAIKVLSDTLAADPQFRERFDREGRAVSQLTHPHICTLYDVGQHDGTAFLVMEYLEGGTLADRLAKGALPVDQALKIAIEIASALDKAHRAGIVHRDLKPGNIMLTRSGAKLLDFGLAKSRGPRDRRGGRVDAADDAGAPHREGHGARDVPVHGAGAARGAGGGRADGSVCVRGRALRDAGGPPGVRGQDAREPDRGDSQGPPAAGLVGAAADARLARSRRREVSREGSGSALAFRPRPARRAGVDCARPARRRGGRGRRGSGRRANGRDGVAGAARGVLGRGALDVSGSDGAARRRRPTRRRCACRSSRRRRQPRGFCDVAGSAGRSCTRRPSRAARSSGCARSTRTRRGRWTEPTARVQTAPFWAPDGRSIAFFTADQLKRIDLDSGLVRTLASAPQPRGGTWGRPGPSCSRPAARARSTPCRLVAATPWSSRASTGRGRPVIDFPTSCPTAGISCSTPSAVPKAAACTSGTLGVTEVTRLFDADSAAVFAAPDRVLFARQGALWAQRLDMSALRPVGEPVPVSTQVAINAELFGDVALSETAPGADRVPGRRRQRGSSAGSIGRAARSAPSAVPTTRSPPCPAVARRPEP